MKTNLEKITHISLSEEEVDHLRNIVNLGLLNLHSSLPVYKTGIKFLTEIAGSNG